jgi:signal transduction histidine kinase
MAQSLFRADLASGRIIATGAVLGPETERWIRSLVDGERRLPASHRGHLLHVGTLDGLPRAVGAAYSRDRHETPEAIAGFVAGPEALAPAFTHVFRHTPLLPPTLAGTRNELLGARVQSRDGVTIYASDAQATGIGAKGRLDEVLGGLEYEVFLKPGGAERLVIGGLPRSRVPLLLGLLGLTAGLLAVAVLQLRREHDLTRLRADFVASVSHELRTPLAQIRLFSETLLLGRVRSETEGRRSLEIIQQESRRLTHLVENVLYFARSERGAQRLSYVPTRLTRLTAELIEAFAPLARSGRAAVVLDARADVDVPVDAGAMRQILLNLLDNAVKYGPQDQTIVVTIDRRGGHAVMTVDDEGPGVPADARGRIWQPYSRLATASASAVAGTGIGLAVVRDLVALHGGAAYVTDAPGGGARFVIEVPGAVAAVDGELPEPASAGSGVLA